MKTTPGTKTCSPIFVVVDAGDLVGRRVGRELDALELRAEHVRHGASEQRLGAAGQALRSGRGPARAPRRAAGRRRPAWPTTTLPISSRARSRRSTRFSYGRAATYDMVPPRIDPVYSRYFGFDRLSPPFGGLGSTRRTAPGRRRTRPAPRSSSRASRPVRLLGHRAARATVRPDTAPEPTLIRATPNAVSSVSGGEPGPARTLTGPSMPCTSAVIMAGSTTPGTKMQSAPAARYARPRSTARSSRVAGSPTCADEDVGAGVEDERHVRFLADRADGGDLGDEALDREQRLSRRVARCPRG